MASKSRSDIFALCQASGSGATPINPTTNMSVEDARKIDDALLRAFCAVQALCAGAIGIAYPAVLCALATWIFIFTGIVVARELTETHIRDERRRRKVFGYCWAALWHLWLPCCLGAELGVESVVAILDQNLNYIDGDVYGTDLVRRLRGEFAWRGAILIQSANCETSDVREYLHAGADGALDKGVSAALQTDVLARVYHDRFPDRSAGAAPKRARRE